MKKIARCILGAVCVFSVQYSVAAAQLDQENPTAHFLHGDPPQLYDYVHGAIDVAVQYELDKSVGGEWIAAMVGATDWSDWNFIEAGWIRFASGSTWETLFPDCVSRVCPYSNAEHGSRTGKHFKVRSKHRWNKGATPWFKVWAVTQVGSDSLWRSAYAYVSENPGGTGGWKVIDSGQNFDNSHFAWIWSGTESDVGKGDRILPPGVRHMFNMYSTVGRGNEFDFSNPCRGLTDNDFLLHYCYTHVETTHPTQPYSCPPACPCGVGKCPPAYVCPICLLLNPYPSNPPATSSCIETAGCVTSWTTTVE